MSSELKRVVVLAEPESLLLPNSLARLAKRHPLVAIIEVPSPPFKKALVHALDAFGPAAMLGIAGSEVLARIVDRVSPERYYSLRKVARDFGIPYERVSGLHSADCVTAIRRHRPDVVFAQVTRRIRPELLAEATFWNKHCSLLPAYAGVFPVFWALLAREDSMGVTIHEMDEEFDRGPILQQSSIPTDGRTFFGAYHELYDEAVLLLDRALRGVLVDPSSAAHGRKGSYCGYPTRTDRAAFKRSGRHFGVPFRLHPRVPSIGGRGGGPSPN